MEEEVEQKNDMLSLDTRLTIIRLRTNHRKGGALMNKMSGLMIFLAVAIVLVAPQIFAATSDWLGATHEYTSPVPGEDVNYPSVPMTTCEVTHESSAEFDTIRKAEDYPEDVTLSSNCAGGGIDMPAKDIQAPNTPDSWIYR